MAVASCAGTLEASHQEERLARFEIAGVLSPRGGPCHWSDFAAKIKKGDVVYFFHLEETPRKRNMYTMEMERLSLADRLFGWWYRIAAPPEVSDSAPLRDRMRVRSGRLTSVIFLMAILNVLFFLIVALLNAPFAAPTLIILLAALMMGVFLNRMGKTTIAGIIVIVSQELALFMAFFMVPGGLSPYVLSIFDFFIISELIATSLLTPWIVFPLTLSNGIFITLFLTFMPKTSEMIQAMRLDSIDALFEAIILQVVVSMIAFLWVRWVSKEIKIKDSAEEVIKLTMVLEAQKQRNVWEKQQLEESIEQIASVHRQVANGNVNVRVPLDQQNVLWPIAGALNNLLARLQRWRYDALRQNEQVIQQNEQAVRQLLYNIQLAKREGKPLQAYKTGTSLDALIVELSKGLAAPPHRVRR